MLPRHFLPPPVLVSGNLRPLSRLAQAVGNTTGRLLLSANWLIKITFSHTSQNRVWNLGTIVNGYSSWERNVLRGASECVSSSERPTIFFGLRPLKTGLLLAASAMTFFGAAMPCSAASLTDHLALPLTGSATDLLTAFPLFLGVVMLLSAFWLHDRRRLAERLFWQGVEAEVYAVRAVRKRVARELAAASK